MQKDSLRKLYIDEPRDLYNAETQLVRLCRRCKGCRERSLREAFQEHLRQTSEQVSRWSRSSINWRRNRPAEVRGMEGLVKEGAEVIDEDYVDEVQDAAIIGAAQKVEHYEIAGYGTVRTFAELLGENEHVLCWSNAGGRKQADQKLTELAQDITSRLRKLRAKAVLQGSREGRAAQNPGKPHSGRTTLEGP